MLFDFSTFAYVVIVFGIPLHELAIYPLASNWIRSTLKSWNYCVWYYHSCFCSTICGYDSPCTHYKATVVCMFVVNSISGSVLSINCIRIRIVLGIVTEIEFVVIYAALFDVRRHHTALKD